MSLAHFTGPATLLVLGMVALGFLLNSTRPFAVPPPNEQFAVLITGCSKGLGLDYVRELLSEEYANVHVFAGVRGQRDVEHLQGQFNNHKRLHAVVLDVANKEHIKSAVREVELSGLPLYALINNAGVSQKSKIDEISADEYMNRVNKILDININGLLRMSLESLELLKKGAAKLGSARIINVSSLMGIIYTPSCGGYCGSKHALEAFTADWRYQLEPHNISVSSLQPGFVKTEMCTDHFCKDPPSVCTDVIVKSLFSSRPRPRYQCASVYGIPGSVINFLVNIVPDRVVDFILRTSENFIARGVM